MERCCGIIRKDSLQPEEISVLLKNGKEKEKIDVQVEGYIHKIRTFKDFMFIIIRAREGIIQTTFERNENDNFINEISENMTVKIKGYAYTEKRAPGGFEISCREIKVLSSPVESSPFSLNKKTIDLNIENNLNMRPFSLRHPLQRALFKVQEGIAVGFRSFLQNQGFTEIRSPKIVSAGAEGGSNIFRLDYFGNPAFLAQSPQFYKQMMVGVYDRVYETGPVFRAEKHSTTRHLNEYTSLDYEMGYIDDFYEIMEMETAVLKHIFEYLKSDYSAQLEISGINIPETDSIPYIRFDRAKEMIAERYKVKIKDPFDLQPEEEHLISDLIKEQTGSEFVFVTHYPSKKRPFYTMDDPSDEKFTLSFDLLFRGMEITTGGQRIHDYEMQKEKIIKKGMNPEEFESYLMLHKYGIPPHGGLGIGLERFTMQLFGNSNIREATMFPRDRNRLIP